MTRIRTAVAVVVAAAMLSVGVAACTPEQQVEVGTGIGNFITLLLFAWAQSVDGLPVVNVPTTTAPPPTSVPAT